MATSEFTTSLHHVCHNCAPSADLPHASEHAKPESQSYNDVSLPHITPLEEALEEERTQLMLANSVLGCLQIAIDPEAITVTPPVYFPDVLELARQFINKSVRRLEYEEVRRLMHGSTGHDK